MNAPLQHAAPQLPGTAIQFGADAILSLVALERENAIVEMRKQVYHLQQQCSELQQRCHSVAKLSKDQLAADAIRIKALEAQIKQLNDAQAKMTGDGSPATGSTQSASVPIVASPENEQCDASSQDFQRLTQALKAIGITFNSGANVLEFDNSWNVILTAPDPSGVESMTAEGLQNLLQTLPTRLQQTRESFAQLQRQLSDNQREKEVLLDEHKKEISRLQAQLTRLERESATELLTPSTQSQYPVVSISDLSLLPVG